MKCTWAYLENKLKERLGPGFLVFPSMVVCEQPVEVQHVGGIKGLFYRLCSRRLSHVTRQVLFRYGFDAHLGLVKVWIHDDFSLGQAKELFKCTPIILDPVYDICPKPVLFIEEEVDG